MSSGRYGVVVCSKCKNPKGADLRTVTTRCTVCGKILKIKKMKIFFSADSQKEVAHMVGELNAKIEGVDLPEPEEKESDIYSQAIKESKSASNERERWIVIGKVLSRKKGCFDEKDIERIISIRGVGNLDEISEILRRSDLFYEPKNGSFKFTDL